jgi:hypothetical protein
VGEAEYIAGHAMAYLWRRWQNGPGDDDDALDRLDTLISGAVGGDPAVLRLRLEAEAAETSERTARRAELALDGPGFRGRVFVNNLAVRGIDDPNMRSWRRLPRPGRGPGAARSGVAARYQHGGQAERDGRVPRAPAGRDAG